MDAKSVVLQKLNRVLHLNNAFTIHSNSSEETSKKYVTNLNFSIQKYWLRLCIKFVNEAYQLNNYINNSKCCFDQLAVRRAPN